LEPDIAMNEDQQYVLYRRIYRMRKKKFKPAEIATVLDLPIGTVQKILNQLDENGVSPGLETEKATQVKTESNAYVIPVLRKEYHILDLGGVFTFQFLKTLRAEFEEVLKSKDSWPVAIKMNDAVSVDSSIVGLIMNFAKEMKSIGRTVVFLDPSKPVDNLFKQLNLYEKIPVYGTELVLQEKIKELNLHSSEEKKRRGRFAGF
jgi:anti-anti-sigma regulatory factor